MLAPSVRAGDAMTTLTAAQMAEKLKGWNKVAICGHINPDGDALGSALALAALLRAEGAEVTCLLAKNGRPPSLYEFLDGYQFVCAQDYHDTPDLFIAVDLPYIDRLGDGEDVLKRAQCSVCIDHHPGYSGFADYYFGDHTAAATCSLVWSVIKASGHAPTLEMATACYIGVMTDTGRFSFQNTNERAFLDAVEMLACGVDATRMSQNVYENKTMSVVKLESRLIDRMRFAFGRELVYSWIDENDFRDLQLDRSETESLPTILRSIEGVEVAALFRVEDGTVRVNLRSRTLCDVGELARRFGGGGHRAAAGVTIEASLPEAIDMLIREAGSLECLSHNGGPGSGCGRE
jgi:phosphoesterase RecJ-like protein